MVIFECGKPFQKKPGLFKGTINNKKTYRVWWLYFSICYIPMSQYDYDRYVQKGLTEWYEK